MEFLGRGYRVPRDRTLWRAVDISSGSESSERATALNGVPEATTDRRLIHLPPRLRHSGARVLRCTGAADVMVGQPAGSPAAGADPPRRAIVGTRVAGLAGFHRHGHRGRSGGPRDRRSSAGDCCPVCSRSVRRRCVLWSPASHPLGHCHRSRCPRAVHCGGVRVDPPPSRRAEPPLPDSPRATELSEFAQDADR